LVFAHKRGKSFIAILLYLANTGSPIRFKHKAKNFRHKVVKHLAIHRIAIFHTVGTTGIAVVITAGTYFTPGSFIVKAAPRATFVFVLKASPAIQTAFGN
jgi:hypothetical protein